ncbi:acyltransferase family protein [Lysobacter solisilvae (ex Woo and Kim 2020)]|uniref:Acyltransferase family protein n=1 Tax=Agrilutibacter terrestris TaxID=2865112 RepID=A0A7H0FY57_9GAMM|nr:acyltransferase family protein [Lysobacter terrestris]QNP40973.1 acyltransferase family protein [Lysobacter terrestris]
MQQRRHDIDALRALAFALLILYHGCMLYVGGEDWGWHLKSTHLAEWLQYPMLFVNRWRMDLIFLISGLSVHFLLRNTGTGAFIGQRSWRLLLPLLFGCLVVVPIQPYAQGIANGAVEPGYLRFLGDYFGGRQWPVDAFDGWEHGFTWNHLWYLVYLWCYTLAFAALLPLLRRLPNPFAHLRGGWLLTVPALPLLLWTLTLQPLFEDTGDLVNDWYRHAVYFSVFLYGWWLGGNDAVWNELVRLRHRALGWALFVFAVYIALVATLPDEAPQWQETFVRTLRNFYIWLALSAILGWAKACLDRPFRWLPWANEAVYPWYVLHQSLIILVAYWLLPLHLGPVLEPVLVFGGTIAGCWLLHEFVIRRVGWLRPCFGLKRLARPQPAQPQLASA